MRKHLVFFHILLSTIYSTCLLGQNQSLEGHVIDALTNESIIGAHVIISGNGTATNNYGFFSLATDQPSVVVTISAIGYQTFVDTVSINQNQLLKVSLYQSTTSLDVVVVSDSASISTHSELSHIRLTQADLLAMPSFMGEPDIFKALQTLPSIQFGKEGNSGLYVRGGTPDQNLILLDDAPLYSVNHLGGFFSVFEPYAINTLNVHTGAFPSRFGGRVSSILDIRIKEADKNQFRSRYRLGLLSTSANFDIPIKKGKSSLLLSLRRGNTDLVSRAITLYSSDGTFQSGYTLFDMHVKYHDNLSDRDQLSASIYFGRDRFFANAKNSDSGNDGVLGSNDVADSEFKSKNQIYWRNFASSLKWSHLFKGGLFFSSTLSATHFQYNIESRSSLKSDDDFTLNQSLKNRFSSGLFDVILRSEFDKQVGKHDLNSGVILTNHSFKPGTFSSTQRSLENNSSERFGSQQQSAIEYNLFFEDHFEINEQLDLISGLHYATYSINGESYRSLQPRISLNTQLNNSKFGMSYARMTQFTHLLTNNGTGVPIDLWVPSTALIAPVNSDIWTLSYGTAFRAFEINAEAYYKELNNLIAFKNGASFLGGNGDDFQDKVETGGKGRVKGLEFQIKKEKGKNTGSVSYTLSKNERKFDNLNDGRYFPFRYDRTHQVSFLYTRNISDNTKVNAAWTFHSGDAITLAVGKYEAFSFAKTDETDVQFSFGPHDAHIYSGRNQYRLPSYHRLDLSLVVTKERKKFMREFSLGIYNAYLRRNPYFVYFDTNDSGDIKLYQVSLFPFVPSFSWSWRPK